MLGGSSAPDSSVTLYDGSDFEEMPLHDAIESLRDLNSSYPCAIQLKTYQTLVLSGQDGFLWNAFHGVTKLDRAVQFIRPDMRIPKRPGILPCRLDS